ncbi:hypothetical protein [Rhizobium ruizarguesonis]|uniref:hypothetical protein n=1 Tax=Rhizobium ruizarguesonis TaxID=2081791 RepID=UPI0010322FDA|nr:hypothetical protein [Rhizobium ruizarguesonis]TCB02969.1 hypothetical protein E0H65_04370 [Rhizobium leguminosarum bv. viciae]TBD31946.1 hypothetical protein ELH19_29825 [Rhizobium ruizarguesonis]TBD33072.1 hypothetical protein ELH18_27360 [Rhizobium ruizarguesonis]TBD51974.1 hypothetical protein ELH15_31735 [Rhizobium ruizarguesonis]TBD75378.1 hypothetical protein ELH14_30880 [Rhizobium ruizarguesonis]
MSLSYHARNAASAVRARKRIRKEGFNMRGDKLWSKDEIEIVRHLAPDYDAICKLIPDRTRKAIRVQASVLGKAHKRHCWTGAQAALLRKLYPDASRERLCESFPDVSWNASRDPLRIVRIQSDEPIGFSASRGRELFVGEGGNLHGPFVKPGEGRAAHHNMAAEKQAIRKVICRSPQ